MIWSHLHLCAGVALGLLPKLSLEELREVLKTLEHSHLSPSLALRIEDKLTSASTYHTIEETLQSWQESFFLLTPFSTLYPPSFLHLASPPPLLFVQGHPTWDTHFNLAVVGKRDAQTHTLKWMNEEFQKFLTYDVGPLNIVSGGARGIDQKAHGSALLYKKATTVFLPSGLDCIYPQSLLPLKESILENQGALVSHYLPQTPMRKHNFYSRNELIAAMADLCVIVEAEKRSGTYKTALYCQNLNTPLAVVPSFPLDTNYSGSLQLIYDGAMIVRDHKDLSLLKSLQPKPTITVDQIHKGNA